MKQRIITAILLMAVALPCVILGGYYFKGLIGVILALSVYEMLHICTKTVPKTIPPIEPSIVFLGESLGINLCLPKNTPAKYAPVSLP